MLDQLLLNVGEGDHVHDHAVAVIFRDDLREAHNLVACHLAGVGEGFKVNGLDQKAALGHHVAGHRRINTAREQQHTAAVGADGHTARALHRAGMDVRAELPHLHTHGDVGVVNVHADTRAGLKEHPAGLGGDLHGVLRKALIRALGLHLEGALTREVRGYIAAHGAEDALHALVAHGGAANGDDAKHLAGVAHHAVHVGTLLLGLDINGALRAVDLKLAVRSRLLAQLAAEHILKVLAVCALEHDLAVLEQKDLPWLLRVIHFMHGRLLEPPSVQTRPRRPPPG